MHRPHAKQPTKMLSEHWNLRYGLNFHMLTITVLNMYFGKEKLKALSYNNYKKFDNGHFRADLKVNYGPLYGPF